MKQPNSSDILEAKEYIRKRLDAELAMEHYLDRQLLKAAREIVSLAYSYNIPPTQFSFDYDMVLSFKVSQIIAKLKTLIEEYDIMLALSTPKMEEETLTEHIFREIDGITYSQRLNTYTNKFKSELESFISAGLIAGLSSSGLTNEIKKTYKHPKQGSIISDKVKGFSSYSRLLLLARHTIADAWMYADGEWMRKNGAVGYMVYRGSSYPCSVCDMTVGYHPINDYVLPVHPNCMCYAVPVYK